MTGPRSSPKTSDKSFTDYSHLPVKLCFKANPFVDYFRENLATLEPDLNVEGLKTETDVHSHLLRMISPAFDRGINYGRSLGFSKLVKLKLNYCKIEGLLCLRDLLYKGVHSTTYGEIKGLKKQLSELELPILEQIKRPTDESAVREYIGQVHITVQLKKEMIQELEKCSKPELPPSDDEDLVKPKEDDDKDPTGASSDHEGNTDPMGKYINRKEEVQFEERDNQGNNCSNKDTPVISKQITPTSQALNSSSVEKVGIKDHGTQAPEFLILASSEPLGYPPSLRRDSSSEKIENGRKIQQNKGNISEDEMVQPGNSTSDAPDIPTFSCDFDSHPSDTESEAIVNTPKPSKVSETNYQKCLNKTKESSRATRTLDSRKDIDEMAKKIWSILPSANYFMIEPDMFQCFICKMKLKYPSGWKRHIMEQHFYYEIFCGGCGQKFKRKETLAKHELFCRISAR